MEATRMNGNITAVTCLLCSVLREQCDRSAVCSTCASSNAVCRRRSLKTCIPCHRAGMDCDQLWPCRPCTDGRVDCTLAGPTMLRCVPCRKLNAGCDGDTPCDRCVSKNRDCHYDTDFTGMKTCDQCKSRTGSKCDGRSQGCTACKALGLICSFNSRNRCDRINPQTGQPCETGFTRVSDLHRHERSIHSLVRLTCKLCDEEKSYTRKNALLRHMKDTHSAASRA